ncbi:HEAT repeat domain-containing protein [Archangium sp.]|uniref:nSTAND3 domain-containing NTPase n=1 Tax=Archangium sp. TaxID=1872627 RepID=UPI002D780BE7|nr:HEAT repeat domain-containing protein [Archangium sp.]
MARRIGVLDQQHPDRVSARIKALLSEQLFVPSLRVEACKDRLLEQARLRLLNRAPREWTREEILHAAESFGGSPLPGAELRTFVPPGNYEDIRARLDRSHVVLLQGPPGAGKTQVLEMLKYEHRRRSDPFAVVTPEMPGELREALRKRGCLFIEVEDPFERPAAGCWYNELSSLLKLADDSDKKIVVTTREATLHRMGVDAAKTFRAFAVPLTYEHYDDEARRQILMKKLAGARPWQREWVIAFEQPILTTLRAPLSLDLFADKVRESQRVEDFNLDAMLRACSVEHLSSRFVDELQHLGREAIPAAIALWGLLSLTQNSAFRAEEASSWRALLRRYPRCLVPLDELISWMKAGRWLTHEAGQYRAHSTTMEGLNRVLQKEPGHAEEVLEALLSGLVDTERLEDAHRLARQLPKEGSIQVPDEVQSALYDHLRSQLVSADETRFRDLFADACEWLDGDESVEVLVDGIARSPRRRKGRWCRVGDFIPPVWSEGRRTRVLASMEARQVVSRYIRLVLPFELHDCSGALASWLWSIGWDLTEDFRKAVQAGLESPGGAGLSEAVHGAFMARQPTYEEWLELILRVWDDVKKKDEAANGSMRRKAQQQMLSELDADIWTEASAEIYHLWEALAAAVKERRYQEGYRWVLEHPRRKDLLSGWSSALSEQLPALPLPRRNCASEEEDLDSTVGQRVLTHPPTVEELRAFFQACMPDDGWALWNLLGQTYVVELLPEMLELLVAGPPKHLDKCLEALSSLTNSGAFLDHLNAALERATRTRRLAILFLTYRKDWKDSRSPEAASLLQEALTKALSPLGGPAFQACLGVEEEAAPAPDTLSVLIPEDRQALQEWCGEMETRLGRAALVVLAALGEDITTPAHEALQSSDTALRLAAIKALALSRTPVARMSLIAALGDEHYECRQHAIRGLAPEANEAERRAILSRAQDGSAPVREACVDAIREGAWSEGLGTLCALLTDTRNRRYGDPDRNVDHHVAFAAAQALGTFSSLPSEVHESLLEFLSWGLVANVDLRVHRQILQLLTPLPLPRLPHVLTELLDALAHSPGQGDIAFWYAQHPSRVNPNGLELRYQVMHGLVHHLRLHPAARETVKMEPFRSMSSHPWVRLATLAWLGLGVIGKRGWSACRELLAPGEEHIQEKTALLVFASAVCGHSVRPWSLDDLLPARDPVWSVAAWLGEPMVPSLPSQWTARWEQAPDVRAWLKALRDEQPWQKAVRSWLGQRFGEPFIASLAGLEASSRQDAS